MYRGFDNNMCQRTGNEMMNQRTGNEMNHGTGIEMNLRTGNEMQQNANNQMNQENMHYYMEQPESSTQSTSLLESILRLGREAVQDGYSNSCAECSVSPQSIGNASSTEGYAEPQEAVMMGYEPNLSLMQPHGYVPLMIAPTSTTRRRQYNCSASANSKKRSHNDIKVISVTVWKNSN